MKAFRKELIESFVVKRALGYVLQDSAIAMLADALVENQKRENTHLPALQEELKKVNKKIDYIAAAIEEGMLCSGWNRSSSAICVIPRYSDK